METATASPQEPTSRPRLRRLGVVAALVAAAAGLVFLDTPLCPTAALFGFPCPGCGLTRASLALLGGDVTRAIELHPLVFLLVPVYGGALLWSIARYVLGPNEQRLTLPRSFDRFVTPLALATLILLIALWLLRFAGYFGGPVPVRRVF